MDSGGFDRINLPLEIIQIVFADEKLPWIGAAFFLERRSLQTRSAPHRLWPDGHSAEPSTHQESRQLCRRNLPSAGTRVDWGLFLHRFEAEASIHRYFAKTADLLEGSDCPPEMSKYLYKAFPCSILLFLFWHHFIGTRKTRQYKTSTELCKSCFFEKDRIIWIQSGTEVFSCHPSFYRWKPRLRCQISRSICTTTIAIRSCTSPAAAQGLRQRKRIRCWQRFDHHDQSI